MKNILIVIVVFCLCGSVVAQEDDWLRDDDWLEQDNFDTFKRKADEKYNNFKDSINMLFADALAGKWSAFNLQSSVPAPKKPEPTVLPQAPKEPEVNLPSQPLPQANVKPTPTPQDKPNIKPEDIKQPEGMMSKTINFYSANIVLHVPQQVDINKCVLKSTGEEDISKFWKQLTKNNIQSSVKELLQQQQSMRLNDWGAYNMALNLSKQLFSDWNSQIATTVFLMNQMEYDVKIARIDNRLFCLLPFDCMVYSVPYIDMDNKKYFIFPVDRQHKDMSNKVYTYTCKMEEADLSLNMEFYNTPLLPNKSSQNKYVRQVSGNKVEMQTNENLMQLYKDYPQVEMSLYANAAVDKDFKQGVDMYFRSMVQDKSVVQAVATLLNYVQYGFDYATDDEQFGYEKPFFCEENFYYPKNDCEDRSILFSYLVRYILKLDVVLLDYPDHIATAVCFPNNDVAGDYYLYKGKKYVVCDPTYIGAKIGMTQPVYRNTKASIILLNPVK